MFHSTDLITQFPDNFSSACSNCQGSFQNNGVQHYCFFSRLMRLHLHGAFIYWMPFRIYPQQKQVPGKPPQQSLTRLNSSTLLFDLKDHPANMSSTKSSLQQCKPSHLATFLQALGLPSAVYPQLYALQELMIKLENRQWWPHSPRRALMVSQLIVHFR